MSMAMEREDSRLGKVSLQPKINGRTITLRKRNERTMKLKNGKIDLVPQTEETTMIIATRKKIDRTWSISRATRWDTCHTNATTTRVGL